MNKQLVGYLTALFILCPAAQAETFTAKVIAVADGDTITVMHDNHAEKIRLSGIDCPEKKQPFGKDAKLFTSQAVFGKEVQVNTIGRDKYGRSIGEVIEPDGNSLNAKLVENGLAWHYIRFDHQQTLDDLEHQARGARRGLWVQDSPTPPWVFRHSKEKPQP